MAPWERNQSGLESFRFRVRTMENITDFKEPSTTRPVLKRPDRLIPMVPREINQSSLESWYRGRERSFPPPVDFRGGSSPPRRPPVFRTLNWRNLPSTQRSDDGGWMSSFLRSRKAIRLQQQLQRVDKEDWMNLRTSQKSDDRGWMEDYLRSRKAIRLQQQLQRVDKELREDIMQLLEINDWMNLSSTHKSDDGGWMSSFLSPELQKPELQRPDGSQVMEPRERNGSGVRIKHQSMEAIITFKEGQPPPWDGMNLQTTLQSVVGAGM